MHLYKLGQRHTFRLQQLNEFLIKDLTGLITQLLKLSEQCLGSDGALLVEIGAGFDRRLTLDLSFSGSLGVDLLQELKHIAEPLSVTGHHAQFGEELIFLVVCEEGQLEDLVLKAEFLEFLD